MFPVKDKRRCDIIENMEISYLGHSAFRIKSKTGTVVCDPFGSMTGLKMPKVAADIVTLSHAHDDHNNSGAIDGTTRREKPFIISEPGEYEIEGISVFGYQTFHDNSEGRERGSNIIYVIQAEDLRLLHLGDLGHELAEKQVTELDGIDVVMVPVGGQYTINAETAIKVIEAVDPYYVLPMHYRTEQHDSKVFGKLTDLEEFTKAYAHTVRTVKSLNLTKLSMPQDVTEVVVFENFV